MQNRWVWLSLRCLPQLWRAVPDLASRIVLSLIPSCRPCPPYTPDLPLAASRRLLEKEVPKAKGPAATNACLGLHNKSCARLRRLEAQGLGSTAREAWPPPSCRSERLELWQPPIGRRSDERRAVIEPITSRESPPSNPSRQPSPATGLGSF